MRLILDTNIWISYLFTSNQEFIFTVRGLIENHDILVSEEVYLELVNTLNKPKVKRYTREAPIDEFLLMVLEKSVFCKTSSTITACRDPNDDKFLNLAVDGKADAIITGDSDLLVLDPFENIRIIQLANFEGL